MKVHILPRSIAVIAVLALSGCSPASSDADAEVTLRKVLADRPAVADADNAFPDAFGFLGPADKDAHELGALRIAWMENFRADPKTAGDDPGRIELDIKAARTQSLHQIIDACHAAFARACASAIDRSKSDLLLTEFEPVLLARYECCSAGAAVAKS